MPRPRPLPLLCLVAALASVGCRSGEGDPPGVTPGAEVGAPERPTSLAERRIVPLVERLRAARRTWFMTDEGRAEQVPQTVRRLVELGPQVVPFVEPELESPTADTRYFAAMVLGQVGDARLVEPLILLLDDPDPDVTVVASEALGRVRDDHTIPLLFRAIETGRVRQVRWALVMGKGRPDDLEHVPFLIRRLLDGNASSRVSAAWLLQRITGEEIAVDPGADRAARELAAMRWEAWWARERGDAS